PPDLARTGTPLGAHAVELDGRTLLRLRDRPPRERAGSALNGRTEQHVVRVARGFETPGNGGPERRRAHGIRLLPQVHEVIGRQIAAWTGDPAATTFAVRSQATGTQML